MRSSNRLPKIPDSLRGREPSRGAGNNLFHGNATRVTGVLSLACATCVYLAQSCLRLNSGAVERPCPFTANRAKRAMHKPYLRKIALCVTELAVPALRGTELPRGYRERSKTAGPSVTLFIQYGRKPSPIGGTTAWRRNRRLNVATPATPRPPRWRATPASAGVISLRSDCAT